uniref:Cathepsin propeptide inhibitor domain-containing protein n=1 Tax=Arundo donax TaxID=35708 RepID=A0A0A9EQS6_ARUDO
MRDSTALMAAAAATALLLLVSVAAADMSIKSYRERSEEETRRVFVEWKAKHGKTYASVGEEERRYVVFKDNLRFIEQHNAAADAGLSSSRLADYTIF